MVLIVDFKNGFQIRQRFKTNSRFIFGKNSVLALALGRTVGSEHAKGLSKVSLIFVS